MAELLKILLLAAIQGISEFFPISSSGHLVVAQHLLKWDSLPLVIDIVLHLGTLLAVFVYFYRDLQKILMHPLEAENRRLILMLILASIPTALIGFLFKDYFEGLFAAPGTVGYAFLITALLLALSKKVRFGPVNGYAAALAIGVFQGLAIAPGISRSGATIAACLILGFGFDFAFRFSFLLSIPAILGAAFFEWRHMASSAALSLPFILGFVVAFGTGLAALAILKRIGLHDKFHRFGYYCLAAGIAVIVLF